MEARIAFDIMAGEPNRLLLILNTIEVTCEGLTRQAIPPRFGLAFRGPDSLVTRTGLSRFTLDDRETGATVIAELKQGHGSPGIERMDQRSITVRRHNVDRAQVRPDITVVENGLITPLGYQASGCASVAP
jgi:hypothetical protein